MEFKISTIEFSKALSLMQGVIQKKSTMPILSNVLLQVGGPEDYPDTLTISATDLDIGLRLIKNCKVMYPGAITVNARALLDLVKMLQTTEVAIKSLPNNYVGLESNRTNAKLVALSYEEFPRLPSLENINFYQVNTKEFLDGVKKTIYSTSSDENRQNLSGIFFEPHKREQNAVALISTDGHRLCRVRKRLIKNNEKFEKSFTMPKKAVHESVRLLESENPEYFELGFLDNHAFIKANSATLNMRLIDEPYPDISQIIPKLFDKILRISRQDLIMSLKRAAVLTNEKSQTVKLILKKDEVAISCINPEAGEMLDYISLEYSGAEVEIGANPRYLLDALTSLNGDMIMIKITDPLSPILITGAEGEDHECVVMPMRIAS